MRAGAEWDSATVASLSPLAVDAYAQLDSVDADTRFHAGLIAIQIGNFPGAHALADTLEARDPGHLFGPILVGALARLEGDTAAYRQALVAFRARADAELARTDRPEYIEHQQLLAASPAGSGDQVTRTIHVAHSPDSDDAFMFYALAEGKLDTGDLRYVHELSDIESLNRRALHGRARGVGRLDPRLRLPRTGPTPCWRAAPPWATATAPGW